MIARQVHEDDRGWAERIRRRSQPAGGEEPLEPLDDPVHAAVLEVPGAQPQEQVGDQARGLGEREPDLVRERLELAAKELGPRRCRELFV